MFARKTGTPMETYPSDLTDAEWVILEPLIPPEKPGGHPRQVDMRTVLNGIFYILRASCAWRMLPRDYPPRSTVYGYFALFRDEGIWEHMTTVLRERCRVQAGREATPSAGIIDNQSVKTTERGGPHGYDGGKKVNGRKRHILVDTTGLVLKGVVHAASLQDRESVPLLLEPIKGVFPRMKKVWVDQGYTGKGREWIEQEMQWNIEIVRHPSRARGEWVPHGDLSDLSTVWFSYERLKPGQRASGESCHADGLRRTSNHNTPETLRLTTPTPRPMLGISGLLQLLTWVERRRVAPKPHSMRKAVSHVQSLTQHGSPPPASRQVISRWADLPLANRQRLLWLLSHLLERQLKRSSAPSKEDGDELDESAK